MFFGRSYDTVVCIWDGVNPVRMTQELIEDMDWDFPEYERLPDGAFRICQYRYDFVELGEYNTALFNITELPEDSMSPEYWDRLKEWKEYQGVE